MSAHPKLLTIGDRNMSLREWSRQRGAAKYTTIFERLTVGGWPLEKAVFTPAGSVTRKANPNAKRKRVRDRISVLVRRPQIVLAPNPHRPNPFPPCVGWFKSWPLDALPILRRVA